MVNKIKYFLSGLFISAASLTFLVGCGGKTPTVSGYNVTYHAGNGHKINGQDEFVASNINEVEIEPTPDYSVGYKFSGWFKNADLSGEQISFPLKVTSDVNLYAKWSEYYAEGFSVSFDADGGSKVPNYIVKKGNSIECSPFTSRDHYEFLGWKEKSNGDYITFPFTPTRNTTLVADWKQVEFKVKFHTQGSMPTETTTKVSGEQVYESKTELSKVDTAPTTRLAGSSFLGWFENEKEGDTPVSFPYFVDNEHKDLYARFESSEGENVYLTDYDEEGEEVVEMLTHCLSIPYAPKPILTNAKKKFLGWTETKGGTTPIKDYSIYSKLTDSVTLYAIWSSKDKATINYYDDDKTTLIESVDYCIDDTIEEAPKFDKKDYFAFYGWKKSDDTLITFPFTIIETTLNLYSNSKRTSFDIEIVDSEKNSDGLHNVLHKINKVSSIEGLPEVKMPGREDDYVFDHYSLDEEGTIRIQTDAKIDLSSEILSKYLNKNTLTIYEQWKNRTYQISIDYGDGTTDTIKTDKKLSYKDLPVIDTEYKKVTSWEDEDGNVYGENKITELPLKELKLKAIWEDKFRSIIVYRGGAEDSKMYSSGETISGLAKNSAKYKDIPAETDKHPQYELVGYYIEDPREEYKGDPKSKTLNDLIANNITEVWEKWEHKTANALIKYYDRDNNLLKSEYKEKISTEPWYSEVKCDIVDYTPYSVQVNGEVPKYFDLIEDPLLELTKVENEVIVVMSKISFTVTYLLMHEGSVIDTHVENHCKTFKEYTPSLPSGTKWDGKWINESGDEVKVGEELVSDLKVYGKVDYPTSSFTVTFNTGSTQLLAKFSDGSKVKDIIVTNDALLEANFPVATCEGNAFDGWYDENGQKAPKIITSASTWYAHWKPLDGYLSMLLKLGEDGEFTSSHSDTGLMTVKTGTKWGDVKNYVPENSYQGGEYEVESWYYLENGNKVILNDETQLTKSDFLYANKKQKIIKPVSFIKDSWSTVSAVANNDPSVTGGKYDNGYEALTHIYSDLEVGSKRRVIIGDEYIEVQVVGLKQDYGDSSCNTKLPITFEFTKLFNSSPFDKSSTSAKWSASSLKEKCDKGGAYYNSLSSILQDNISTCYKYYSSSKMEANQLFVPSYYEITVNTSYQYNKKEFQYSLYKNSDNVKSLIMKEFGDMGACGYWVRDGEKKYLKIIKKSDGTLSYESNKDDSTRERGVALMFCLGKAY